MKKQVAQILQMTYSEFVSFIGIENTPPGSLDTIKFWKKEANINEKSSVLDLACNSGYTSFNINKLSNCETVGIDVNSFVIENANARSTKLKHHKKKIRFFELDAINLNDLNKKFTHILAGASFGFMQNRYRILIEVFKTLLIEGKLCVANFYYIHKPGLSMINKTSNLLGYKLDPGRDLEYWLYFYLQVFSKTCKLSFEELPVWEEPELKKNVEGMIYSHENIALRELSDEEKEVCFDRFYKTRLILNEHRKYQKYFKAVFEK